MSIDPSKLKPVAIQKTLIAVNNFVVNTASFLNTFSNTCEKKLSGISSRITELEILLSVFEAKLNSIPGLDEDPPLANIQPSAGTTSTTASSSSSSSSSSASSSSSSHPLPQQQYAETKPPIQLETISSPSFPAIGTIPSNIHHFPPPQPPPPPPLLQSKISVFSTSQPQTSSSILSSSTAQTGSSQGGESTAASAAVIADGSSSSSLERDNSRYAPFFKMIKVGVPLVVVQNKAKAAGLDPTVLQ